MLLKKYSHSCVRLTKDGNSITFDPGSLSADAELQEALAGTSAIVITHEHFDHFHQDAVAQALTNDAQLQVYGTAEVASVLTQKVPDAAARVHAVEPGSELSVAGFTLKAFGGQHALIHPRIKTIDNIAFLVDGELYHPGDCLIAPDGVQVKTLLVPLSAPWSKASEVVDFACALGAERAYQIHDGLLTELGLSVYEGQVGNFSALFGTQFSHLGVGEEVQV